MPSKCEGLVTGHDFSSHLQSFIVSSEGVSTAVTPGYTAADGRLAIKVPVCHICPGLRSKPSAPGCKH